MDQRPKLQRKVKNNITPQLVWEGKHTPAPVVPPVPQLVEIFAPSNNHVIPDTQYALSDIKSSETPPAFELSMPNSLFLGDNQDVLTHLLANGYSGKVKLIYIDPPFDSGVSYHRKVRLRGPKALTMQTSADHVFGQQAQFHDRWSENAYLQFIYDRLPLLHELLAEDGSLWLHCDHRQVHHLRVLLQEIFGEANYLNTIAWRSQVARGAKVNAFYFPFSTHYIEIFAKNRRAPTTWNALKKQIVLTEQAAAHEFMRDGRGFFRTSDPGAYTFASLKALHAEERLYAPYGGAIVVDEATQRVYASNGGNIGVKYYLADLGKGKFAVERAIDNLWDDVPGLGTTPGEDLGYPTQKTEALLERIIRTATNPGDLVLDCFMGSGTTMVVAQQLGRRWIGCDNNQGALLTTRRRLQALPKTGQPAPTFALYHLLREPVPPDNLPSTALQAEIAITRQAEPNTAIRVELIKVTAPRIMAQLTQTGLYPAQEPLDWRTLVDCVAIDPTYDGQVFRSALVDAPLKKSSQVRGLYTVATPPGPTCVAVRITDLLGEELIITTNV